MATLSRQCCRVPGSDLLYCVKKVKNIGEPVEMTDLGPVQPSQQTQRASSLLPVTTWQSPFKQPRSQPTTTLLLASLTVVLLAGRTNILGERWGAKFAHRSTEKILVIEKNFDIVSQSWKKCCEYGAGSFSKIWIRNYSFRLQQKLSRSRPVDPH